MKISTSRARAVLVRLLLGLVIVPGIYFVTDANERVELSSTLFNFNAGACGVAMTILVLAVRAIRWRVLFNDCGGNLGIRQLPVIYGASFFLGLVSPGRVGELARVWYARRHALNLYASAFSVILDRMLDAVPTILIAAIVLFSINAVDVSTVASIIITASAVIATGFAAMFVFPGRLYAAVEVGARRILRRLSNVPSPDDSREMSVSRTAVCKVLTLSLISQVLLVFQAYFFALAVGAEANPLVIYGVVSLATFVGALPISIGGLGTREVAVVLALQAIGLTQAQGVAFSVMTLANFLIILVASAFFFVLQPSGNAELGVGTGDGNHSLGHASPARIKAEAGGT